MNKNIKEGWYNLPPINRDRYGERAGLEGPFQTKLGKVVYYDPKEGAYYDPDSDIYLSYEEWTALNESAKFTIVYTTNNNRTVPMAHKTYDTREAATKIAESAVKLGTYRHFTIVEAGDRRAEYQNMLWGPSHTSMKAAQAEKNRTAAASSADYTVFTLVDMKADSKLATEKFKEVAALYKKEKTEGTAPARRLMGLRKAADELEEFPSYIYNQVYDMNGYGALFTGEKPWDSLSDKVKSGVVRKQAQIKNKRNAINALLEKLGVGSINFTSLTSAEKTTENKLPPHLAKFVGKDGNFTPEAEARIQAGRKKGTWVDKTPKGYGPDEKVDEADVDPALRLQHSTGQFFSGSSYKDEMNKILGAIDAAKAAMPSLKASGDQAKAEELRIAIEMLAGAVNKGGGTNSHVAKIHELLGTQTESENLSEADTVHATYLFSMSKPDYENPANNDTKYIKLDFMVPDWGQAHPQALSKQIKDNPTVEALRKAGYINFKSIASWKADLEGELAAAQEKLGNDRLIASYAAELKNTVATLTQAKQIMSSNKVLGENKEAAVYEAPQKKGRNMNGTKPPRKGTLRYEIAKARKEYDSTPERYKEIDKLGNDNHHYGNARVRHHDVEEAAMPASIVKHKSELAGMSDKDLATKLGSKSDDELRQMAWRHGHGKGSDHYVKRVTKGKGVTEGKSPAYNKDAVDKEIGKDKRIKGKEAKAIHGLLKGRTAEKKVVKEDIALDAAGMEQDHEVQMARGQLYHAARDAIRLHQMLKTISEDNGIEAWVQSKITTAAEYLKTVADYMEYELINDGIDSTVGIAADQVQMPIGETCAGGIAGVVMPLGAPVKRKTNEEADSLGTDSNGNPITMQDIRLYAGEGKLTSKTIAQAVAIIKKHRDSDALKYRK